MKATHQRVIHVHRLNEMTECFCPRNPVSVNNYTNLPNFVNEIVSPITKLFFEKKNSLFKKFLEIKVIGATNTGK